MSASCLPQRKGKPSARLACTAGVLVQFVVRSAFSFQYEKRLKNLGAPFSGIGIRITVIVYFLLIKGLKGTTLLQGGWVDTLYDNIALVLVAILLIATAICLWLQKLYHANPLRIVVLTGTFSLAMALAGKIWSILSECLFQGYSLTKTG